MTSYDRLDWHLDSALAAGQPPEQAFTHIGLYLAWLIRRDLHDPAALPDTHIQAVKDGVMTGSDLSDDIDSKLISHVMSADGAAFSGARYATSVTEYGTLFDELWIADGRPAPADGSAPQAKAELPTTGSYVMFPPDFSQAEIDAFLADYPGGQIDQISLPPPDTDRPRVSPELEGLIPTDLIPSSDVSSARASEWRSSLLNRALTRPISARRTLSS